MRVNKILYSTKTPPYIPEENFKFERLPGDYNRNNTFGQAPFNHIKVGNIDQFYFNNKMVQICDNGKEVIYTTVNTDDGSIISRFIKYICQKCQDFDCEWCKGDKNSKINQILNESEPKKIIFKVFEGKQNPCTKG